MKKNFLLWALLALIPTSSWALEVYRNGDMSLGVGLWGQGWYQYVRDFDRDGDGEWDDDVHDFIMRRFYLNVEGAVTQQMGFFVHYAGDRIGQEGLDNSGLGLGSGMALRDGWVDYKICTKDLILQAGRMYVPFTRDYGTTSTKALLTTELNWGQGGLRSAIFYPSKVGRDDGVTVWGNVMDDKLQYRLMIGEGEENKTTNPDDTLRFAGRLSISLLDSETAWFNKGTYLGEKKILALGCGADQQADLMINGQKKDYESYTVDVHLDYPLGECPVTAEIAYIWINNAVSGITWSDLAAGTDGDMVSAKAGILLLGKIQPFWHIETIMPDGNDSDDTLVYGIGCNYYLKGLANKLSAEWSVADEDDHTVDMITLQAAFGF